MLFMFFVLHEEAPSGFPRVFVGDGLARLIFHSLLFMTSLELRSQGFCHMFLRCGKWMRT